METGNTQSCFYPEMQECIDMINQINAFERGVLKNIEKIVLNNKGGDLALIDKLVKYVTELHAAHNYVK